MGKKLDAFLGRTFKTAKFKATVDLAISRLAVLKKQRQVRCSQARSDVLQLLNLGHHERALLRVEQVIKEQNMLDVFVTVESYCLLLIERVNLIEQEKVCPDELKEAISSLLYAASRCGDLPELQEIRAVFTSRYGKEFAARAIELRNNCGVNPTMIQKLSTRMPSLESRMKVLQEIATENGIVLQLDQDSSSTTTEEKSGENKKQNEPEADPAANSGYAKVVDGSEILPEVREKDEGPSGSMKKTKYRDVADAAQAAFESAEYAAAAARAAMELSRSGPHDPDDQNSPNPRRRKVSDDNYPVKSKNETIGNEPMEVEDYHSETEDGDFHNENQTQESKQSKNAAEYNVNVSSDVVGQTDGLGFEGFDMKPSLLSNAEASGIQSVPRLNLDKPPISVRTRRMHVH